MSKNELRSSGERRRRAFANGAGELSQCCRPRCRSFEKSLTLSLNPTIISSGMAKARETRFFFHFKILYHCQGSDC